MKYTDLTREFLWSVFDLDQNAGVLRWKYRADCSVTRNKRFSGRVAGSPCNGYIGVNVTFLGEKVFVFAHRIIWFMVTGEWPKNIDHVNGVKNDNRWANMRLATKSENAINTKIRSDNSSGHRGVWFCQHRNRWVAEIQCEGTTVFRSFRDLADAVRFRRRKALELFAEFVHPSEIAAALPAAPAAP